MLRDVLEGRAVFWLLGPHPRFSDPGAKRQWSLTRLIQCAERCTRRQSGFLVVGAPPPGVIKIILPACVRLSSLNNYRICYAVWPFRYYVDPGQVEVCLATVLAPYLSSPDSFYGKKVTVRQKQPPIAGLHCNLCNQI